MRNFVYRIKTLALIGVLAWLPTSVWAVCDAEHEATFSSGMYQYFSKEQHAAMSEKRQFPKNSKGQFEFQWQSVDDEYGRWSANVSQITIEDNSKLLDYLKWSESFLKRAKSSGIDQILPHVQRSYVQAVVKPSVNYQLCVIAHMLGSDAQRSSSTPSPSTTSNLDTLERWQAAQANQQQADRVFAGKRRSNDENANTDQPAAGPTEGMATNRGRVRVNMAYCIDSDKRPYGGSLKCSAQRFGVSSVEPGASVQVLLPNSGLQAFIFACTHPARPYDVTYANNGLTGRCAAF